MPGPIRSWGLVPGLLPAGPRNLITDVPGVLVGHWTLHNARHHTGVTAVVPRPDPYAHPLTAACEVVNGYGKTCGLVQMEELGRLESPLLLTNTLNVGLAADALVSLTVQRHPGLRSFNPVVGECNDATLNTITERVVGEAEVRAALDAAGPDFAQGCAGAGAGMICHELKGGIGSASRVLPGGYTVGVLALCNHGQLAELNVLGRRPGAAIRAALHTPPCPADKGSCMMILATDLPLSSRQLRRVVRRCAAGLARCGSYWGHGSGDIAIGFTTAHCWNRNETADLVTQMIWNEDRLDPAFAAAAEATEEAVLNALAAARTTTGPDGTACRALCEFKKELGL